MLLAVNIGNTNIRLGIFEGDICTNSWTLNTHPIKTSDELYVLFSSMYKQYQIKNKTITDIVVGSVVPNLTYNVEQSLKKLHKIDPIIVDRNTKSPIKNNSDQMGTDLYANAVAAHFLYKGNKIIIDFGTALTFTALNSIGEILGAIIAPGIITSLHSLIGNTAQLTEIELKKPKSVLGTDTISRMQSGMVYGFLSMVEGLIDRIIEQQKLDFYIITTGGLGSIYAPLTTKININDKLHTLKGLNFLYDKKQIK